MHKKTVSVMLGLGGALVAGSVLAASLANVTSSTFATGQATLNATCLNPTTSEVNLSHVTTWESNTWITSGIRLQVTDPENDITCNGRAVRVVAIDQWDNVLSLMNTGVIQSGNDINMEIPLRAPIPADAIDRFAVSILTLPHWGPQYSYLSQPFLAVSNAEGLLTWNRVEGATNYRVVSDGATIFEGNVNSMWIGRLPNGTYDLQVQAFVNSTWGELTPAGVTRYQVTDGQIALL